MNPTWTKYYGCRYAQTAIQLAKGDILKEYGVEPDTEAFSTNKRIVEQVATIKVTIPIRVIMEAQKTKAERELLEGLQRGAEQERLRRQGRARRAQRRREDARVVVSDSKITHYGRDRRQYLAEVELQGARITVSAIGVDLTPTQHRVFKERLAMALQDGIVAESESTR